MKVYLVYDGDSQEGYTPLHIASSKEKATEWLNKWLVDHPSYGYTVEIEEVEVDGKERIV